MVFAILLGDVGIDVAHAVAGIEELPRLLDQSREVTIGVGVIRFVGGVRADRQIDHVLLGQGIVGHLWRSDRMDTGEHSGELCLEIDVRRFPMDEVGRLHQDDATIAAPPLAAPHIGRGDVEVSVLIAGDIGIPQAARLGQVSVDDRIAVVQLIETPPIQAVGK